MPGGVRRRLVAAMANEWVLFARVFIGSPALRLFALITPCDLAGHYDRVAVRRGFGTPDAPGVVDVFVVAIERAWRYTAPCRGCRRPCGRMDVQPGCLTPYPGFSRTRVFAHTARPATGRMDAPAGVGLVRHLRWFQQIGRSFFIG